jgi:hypothetical protein
MAPELHPRAPGFLIPRGGVFGQFILAHLGNFAVAAVDDVEPISRPNELVRGLVIR